MKPIIVACRCGWEGPQDQLVKPEKFRDHQYCPACGRLFRKWPSSTPSLSDNGPLLHLPVESQK